MKTNHSLNRVGWSTVLRLMTKSVAGWITEPILSPSLSIYLLVFCSVSELYAVVKVLFSGPANAGISSEKSLGDVKGY